MAPLQKPDSSPNFQIISTIRYDPALSNLPIQSGAYPSPENSPYYLLSHHRVRLLAAAKAFQWPAAIALLDQPPEAALALLTDVLDKHTQSDPTRSWRLRVLLDHSGNITAEANPLPTPPSPHILLLPPDGRLSFSNLLQSSSVQKIKPWTLVLDTEPTPPSLFTTHKTTARDGYTASRARTGISSPQEEMEVLIHNPAGEVMEGSITTVYFRRQRRKSDSGDGDNDEYYWVTPPLSCGGNAGTTRRYALAAGMCVEEVVRVEDLRLGMEVWLSNGVRGFWPAVLMDV
ncbi:hypothetical protein AJ79_05877 [Helicocarpus griseus UAMH5409]|uniref:Aminodeoxychorismate lyase n=1 Tax=Helicocarpus griseus UAMH5409 TaxID=1447875 RepID=A0A2B7XJI0_9EURO|nr:hypothetical protein AJ79_05877 [Helicocarpus griseus UAMH5409]